MKRFLVLYRSPDGEYYLYSSYDDAGVIHKEMYREFRCARLNSEYLIVDTAGTGNAIVGTYKIERRVILRKLGSLEKAWPDGKKDEDVGAYAQYIGDDALLVRFV